HRDAEDLWLRRARGACGTDRPPRRKRDRAAVRARPRRRALESPGAAWLDQLLHRADDLVVREVAVRALGEGALDGEDAFLDVDPLLRGEGQVAHRDLLDARGDGLLAEVVG